jgi:hypothetical protein
MQACAEHVQYQLPNEHSRVGFLLDAIQIWMLDYKLLLKASVDLIAG